MKLRLHFGLHESREVIDWPGTIYTLPKLVNYAGKKWRFNMWDDDESGAVSFNCYYGQVYSDHPDFTATNYDNFDWFIGSSWRKCECGAKFTSAPQFHMQYCPKHIPVKKDD